MARSPRPISALLVACALGCATGSEDVSATPRGTKTGDAGLDGSAWVDTGSSADATSEAGISDATTSDADATADTTKTPVCGDGVIDPGEVCDDGAKADGDGCSADCKSVECAGARTWEDPTTHHCYFRSTDVVSRASAASKCAAWGGHLARFEAAAERNGPYAAVLGDVGGRIWIGLSRVDGSWTWDDGTAATPSELPWSSGEPSGDGSCVEWQKDGNDYNDLGCGNDRDFVCERAPKGS